MVLFCNCSKICWASLGFLGVSQGSWEVLGDPLGFLGRPFVITVGPWWSLGCPFGVPGGPQDVLRRSQEVLGEVPKGIENTEGFLGVYGLASGGALS